ncbi:hypothetical protein EBZ70_01900 [bacterium]|nr:hypothetical protein [bacterium]
MAHSRRSLAVLFLVCVCALIATAQTRPPAGGPGFDPSKTPAATVKVMALSASVPAEGLFYLKTPKEGMAIALPRGRFSAPFVPFSHTQTLTFGVKAAAVEGVPSFRVLTQAKWPEGDTEEVLVFLATTGEGADSRMNAIAVENGPRVFPPRSVRVMNFTGQKLFAQFGTVRSELAPGPSRGVPYPEVQAEPGRIGRFRVGLGRMDAQGGPQILFSGWADASPESRTLIVVTPLPGSDKPEVKILVDNLPRPPKPPGSPR